MSLKNPPTQSWRKVIDMDELQQPLLGGCFGASFLGLIVFVTYVPQFGTVWNYAAAAYKHLRK